MKQLKSLSALLMFLLSLLTFPVQGNEISHFQKLVYPVLVKGHKKGTRTSHGSSFVVLETGNLVTNYHVIKSIFKNGKINPNIGLYVRVKDIEYKAELVKFDSTNDLALLKIPYDFAEKVKISPHRPQIGEEVLSLGFHDTKYLAINQGRFNSILEQTSNELMAISVPVNFGMSGGPLLNMQREVIGVNVMKHRKKESSAYAINSERLRDFLFSPAQENFEETLKAQMRFNLKQISQKLNAWKEFKQVNNWHIPNFDQTFNCGEYHHEWNLDRDDLDKNQNAIDEQILSCIIDDRLVPLSSKSIIKAFAFFVSNLRGKPNTRSMAYYNHLNNMSKAITRPITFGDDDAFECDKLVVKNKFDMTFKVGICIKRPAKLPSFLKGFEYNFYQIRFISMTKEMDDLAGRVSYFGDRELAKDIIKNLLDNIYYQAAESEQQQERGIASEKAEKE